MTRSDHETISERLSESVLGHLSPDEQQVVDAHARACVTCAAELSELTLVLQGLALSPEQVPLPATLKARVLNAIARTPSPGVVRPRGSWRARMAVAAALVLALSGGFYLSMARHRGLSNELARAQSRAAALQERLDDFAGQTDLALSILTANDSRRIELGGADGWRASAARAYWSPTRGLLVVADHLPTPPAGRIYQVWVIGGGAPVSAGLLTSPRTGRGMLLVPPPQGIATGKVTVAVTDEPPGGLTAPTGAMRVFGSL